MGKEPGIIEDIIGMGLYEHLLSLQIIVKHMLVDTFLLIQSKLAQIGKLLRKKKHVGTISFFGGQTKKPADIFLDFRGQPQKVFQDLKILCFFVLKSRKLCFFIIIFSGDPGTFMVIEMIFLYKFISGRRRFLVDICQDPGAA